MRLPAQAVDKLHRAAEALGMRKKDLVAGLVSRYVDPDNLRGLDALGPLSTRGIPLGVVGPASARGSYSFQPHDSHLPPEVMTAEQAADFLQVDAAVVIEMAAAGKLPGRRLGGGWRFSRAALVDWLAEPEKRR